MPSNKSRRDRYLTLVIIEMRNLFVSLRIIQVFFAASASSELIYRESPKVKAKENNLIVKAGAVVTMTCNAYGVPAPTIKWLKEGKRLYNNSKYMVKKIN